VTERSAPLQDELGRAMRPLSERCDRQVEAVDGQAKAKAKAWR
jgi:hypothetical protein